jgi:hypothetical protein
VNRGPDLIRGWLRDVVHNQHFDGAFLRFQPEAKLLLHQSVHRHLLQLAMNSEIESLRQQSLQHPPEFVSCWSFVALHFGQNIVCRVVDLHT